MNARSFVTQLVISTMLLIALCGYCICCASDEDFGHDIYDDIRERHADTID